jgi:hypothetical protein
MRLVYQNLPGAISAPARIGQINRRTEPELADIDDLARSRFGNLHVSVAKGKECPPAEQKIYYFNQSQLIIWYNIK